MAPTRTMQRSLLAHALEDQRTKSVRIEQEPSSSRDGNRSEAPCSQLTAKEVDVPRTDGLDTEALRIHTTSM